MFKGISSVRTIAFTLAVLYAISLLICIGALFTGGDILAGADNTRNQILSILLGACLIGSLLVFRFNDFGRKLLVISNILMAVYLIEPYLLIYNGLPLIFLLVNIIVFVYFTQPHIQDKFELGPIRSAGERNWQSVLVIDDDETLVKTVRPALMANGYSVLTANSGEDGLAIARSQRPDLIILDVILPGIKGRDVCKKLKADKATHDIPVIFLTAKDSQDDIQAELQAGGEMHLTKPVDPNALLSSVRSVLAKTES